MLVKVFSTEYGNGGSGEPIKREAVQGIRWSRPNGASSAACRSGPPDFSQRTPTIAALTAPRSRDTRDRCARERLPQALGEVIVRRKGACNSARVNKV